MTHSYVQPDIGMLKALSRLLARQILDLEAALDMAETMDVQAIVIHAQTSREEVLELLRRETARLGATPETRVPDRARVRLSNGHAGVDESVIDEVAQGETELRLELQKGAQNQTLLPSTRHFLGELLTRLVTSAERYSPLR